MGFTTPSPLKGDDTTAAVRYLQQYFHGNGDHYTGARFERLCHGGERAEIADVITAEDLVAVTLLSVRVPGSAALQILERRPEAFSRLLTQVPRDVDLVDAAPHDFASLTSPAYLLWKELKELHGIGWVTAGKLVARKRPRLIPVYDEIVRDEVGRPNEFWASLQGALAADGQALHQKLLGIRKDAGVGDDVSALRVFDVVTWMYGTNKRRS